MTDITIYVEGKTFIAHDSLDEPRVRDVELADWLGYDRPRKIRELIRKLEKSGFLPGINVCPHRGRTLMPKGGEREDVVYEYLLTEAEALLVATRSETATARTLVADMIRVYREVKRQLHTPVHNSPVFANPNRWLEAANQQVRDNVLWRNELRGLFRAVAIQLKTTWRTVEGFVRTHFGVVSYLRLSAVQMDEARRLLLSMLQGTLLLPMKKQNLPLLESRRTQLPIPGIA